MLTMVIQSGIHGAFPCSSFPYHKPIVKLSLMPSSIILDQKTIPISRNQRLTALAAPEALTAETPTETGISTSTTSQEPILTQEFEKGEVTVKQVEKPRLVLKFIWMEKNIGLALDQVIPGHGTVPLSPYFFWPRKDAWEELKATLESKPWISQKKMIILLNQATDIINLWQQSGGNLS